MRSEMVARDDNWKLFDPNKKKGEFELYNVRFDPAEARNGAAKEYS